MSHPVRVLFCGLLAVSLVVLAGCGSTAQKVKVEGKVKFPATMKFADQDNIALRFGGDESIGGKGGTATVSRSDGSFTTSDLIPGKYKVSVNITPYAGLPGADKRAQQFESFNKSFDDRKTPLEVEITAEPMQSITVDIEAKKVTKN